MAEQDHASEHNARVARREQLLARWLEHLERHPELMKEEQEVSGSSKTEASEEAAPSRSHSHGRGR